MFGIRTTLRIGSVVFGASALLLVLAPAFFLSLLALPTEDASLQWSMRMIGITLVALAGNMWANSSQPDDLRVRTVGAVMAVAASGLGLLTLMIPAELTWFSWAYAFVGFAFGLNYTICLVREKY
jgi:hypothetical protein